MSTFTTLISPALAVIFILFIAPSNAQTQLSGEIKENALIGIWAMFKDRHPDGWGRFNPPYEYLEFRKDGGYVRTYFNNKTSGLIFGHYKISTDSILFYDNIATNGIIKNEFPPSTARLYSVSDEGIELWEDWDRILSKRIKKWGHKKKYRPLTLIERQNLEQVTKQIFDGYLLMEDENIDK